MDREGLGWPGRDDREATGGLNTLAPSRPSDPGLRGPGLRGPGLRDPGLRAPFRPLGTHPRADGNGRAVSHRRRPRATSWNPASRQLALLACYLAAGIAATWPRAAYLAGRLPATRDVGAYVWGFWWMAHQATHLGNPWFTSFLAAPVGTQFGFHTLMPLPGLVMTPVTLLFGPSASYNLLSIVCPGLLCYAMYRAARLWLGPGLPAITAGAFFGLSSTLAWRSWYEINLALGALFLPMALEAAVRLRRSPGWRAAAILGLVLGAALLTDQESAMLAAILAGLALLPWLLRRLSRGRLRAVAVTAATGAVVASPQLIAMIQQTVSGGAWTPPWVLAQDYNVSGASLVQMFAPSPRLASYGLTSLASLYYHGPPSVVEVGYGLVLSLAALAGLVTAWRRPGTRLLGLLWLACTVLALGSLPYLMNRGYLPLAERWHGVRMSALMPFTWFVRLPGTANFREADRFTELGLVAACLLAGAAVGWFRAHAKPVIVLILALGVLEAGWSGNPDFPGQAIGTIPTAMPLLDGPIAADHSGSVVVDIPFGIRGGLPVTGRPFPPETMVLATADGHPLADGYASRIPPATLAGIRHEAFYRGLMNAQDGRAMPELIPAARDCAQRLHIGWVLAWSFPGVVRRYLRATGFRPVYHADGVWVYRPVISRGKGIRAVWPHQWRGSAGTASPAGPPPASRTRPSAASPSRPSAASPLIRPRSPAASPARSSADRAARIRA